ncbi:uncharacterized protein MELLADRAFT_123765 [Melampsora larici-populina 98AG31]|uniref:Secreted protein n=1 Tax=Melampsora larici-populina (strain 98AG31 / pathotype 3-4-7) TaxID=747676 RepID=F4R3V9_MELLP|nr:uncharacterized protein MELLADRAFT_123765 [Melampsora larici-populina 98AG31]EGG13094.1 secreted protein [Melampsora larici-populina 98AG31]
MLFQSHHGILIAMCVTHLASGQQTTKTIQCIGGFSVDKTAAKCNDKDFLQYNCPLAQCGKDGHLWVPLSGCLHNGVLGSGISNQQCSSYSMNKKDGYTCRNTGGEWYSCPYKADNVPFITCSKCTASKPTAPQPRN